MQTYPQVYILFENESVFQLLKNLGMQNMWRVDQTELSRFLSDFKSDLSLKGSLLIIDAGDLNNPVFRDKVESIQLDFPFLVLGDKQNDPFLMDHLDVFFAPMYFADAEKALGNTIHCIFKNWNWLNRRSSRSDAYLSAILSGTQDNIYFKDLESKFLEISTGFIDKFRRQKHELLGKSDFDFFTEEHANEAFEDEQGIIENRIPISKTEKETWPDRDDTWVSTVKAPLYDSEGNVIGTFGISRDVTQQILAQERILKTSQELQASKRELERSNQELEEFAYVASHDLQEPLRKITAFGGRLKAKIESQLEDKELDYLNRMLNSADRMSRLINDLLKYSRVTTQGRSFKKVDLNEVLSDVIGDLEYRLESCKGKIICSELPFISGDSTQMHQLFQNIIGNALKFRQPDLDPVVEIACRHQNNKKVEITVKDNGIGFEPTFSGKIFKVFERLHNAKQYDGTGIGLSVCKKIVERHKGSIRAKGALNEGAKFTIQLPAYNESEEALETGKELI